MAWTGSINISTDHSIDGIHLSYLEANDGRLNIPSGPLEVLCLIETCRVPFHLAAGPSLEVETSSDEATSWFSEVLLQEHASRTNDAADGPPGTGWVENGLPESNIGILARPQLPSKQDIDSDVPRITEILFYAVKSSLVKRALLPTPPPSSPRSDSGREGLSSEDTEQEDASDCIVLYALPLSSDLLYNPAHYKDADISHRDDGQAHFLPTTAQLQQQLRLGRKRDQLQGLFDGVPDRRRQAKRLRLESLSQPDMTAKYPQRGAFCDTPVKAEVIEDMATSALQNATPVVEEGPKRMPTTASRTLSRSPSITLTRPASSKGPPMLKRSSLSHLTTSETLDDGSFEERNKATISRTVMAGMRMFGLQQQRTRGTRIGSFGSLQELQTQTHKTQHDPKDDEYKGIYHQTYKGTIFAFRRKVADVLLTPESIRDVVDRLLMVFCNEPP